MIAAVSVAQMSAAMSRASDRALHNTVRNSIARIKGGNFSGARLQTERNRITAANAELRRRLAQGAGGVTRSIKGPVKRPVKKRIVKNVAHFAEQPGGFGVAGVALVAATVWWVIS